MATRRLLLLELVLACGLSLVFFIPKTLQLQAASVPLALPDYVGNWFGTDHAVTVAERDSLGPDTEFVRKLYTNGQGDEIYASIVMSGPDMNTSIHRPERCLPAQGWTIADSRVISINTVQGPLRITRLHDSRSLRTKNGVAVQLYSLNYYWFVGSNASTPSHLERTFIDIRDRVLKGRNQRWAYLTVVSNVTQGVKAFGRNEQETDAAIQRFISDLLPLLEKPQQKLAQHS